MLNGDLECAERGCFSLSELESININGLEIDRDLHWQPVTASCIDDIKEWI